MAIEDQQKKPQKRKAAGKDIIEQRRVLPE